MNTLAVFAASCLTLSSAIAADDSLLTYLTPLPFYSSDSEISPELVLALEHVFKPSRTFTLRKATLLEFEFNRKFFVKTLQKEGPPIDVPSIGPQPDGFLFTIRIFPTQLSQGMYERRQTLEIGKITTLPEHAKKWISATIPTRDKAHFYSIHLEAGLKVSDDTLRHVIAVVSEYASK